MTDAQLLDCYRESRRRRDRADRVGDYVAPRGRFEPAQHYAERLADRLAVYEAVLDIAALRPCEIKGPGRECGCCLACQARRALRLGDVPTGRGDNDA